MATTKTIGTGKDYTTLQAWEDWADGEASAAQWAECYSTGSGDLGPCIVAGWTGTPDADNYPRIYAPYAERGDGTNDYTSGAYCVATAASYGIWTSVAYTRVEGMIVYSAQANVCFYADTSSNWVFDGCVAVVAAGHDYQGFSNYNVDGIFRNCVAYGTGATGTAVYGFQGYGGTVSFLNCSADGWEDGGFFFTNSSTVTSTNNISGNNAGADYAKGTATVTQTYCLSEDATADDFAGGAGNLVSQTWANVVTTSGSDLKLNGATVQARMDNPAYNAGTTLSATNDALNDTGRRPQSVAFDMGAFELAYAEPTHTHRADLHVRGTGVQYNSAKVISKWTAQELAMLANDALDAVSDLTFTNCNVMSSRNDNTAGA